MRKIFIVDHDFPPTADDLIAATIVGAAEVVCGIPPTLAAEGIDTFGYHEVVDPTVVPASVSMRQARLELLATPSPAGGGQTLLDVVAGYIATQPQATQIEWNYATDIWRDRDLVIGIGAALGLTDAQIDALFIAAAAIP